MALFNIENLTFSYPLQEKPVLEGISLDINEGEFTVLCGQSGCGKTTLMKLLKNELRPKGELGGKIAYCGKDLLTLDERVSAAEIGFVLQNPESQIVTDRVWHELSFGLEPTANLSAAASAKLRPFSAWKSCSEAKPPSFRGDRSSF